MISNLLVDSSHRARGSVLLLVILVTGILSTVVASFHATMEDTMTVTRNECGSISAEFAAESGMEYAQRRLMIDPDWTGTGSQGILLPDGKTRFVVQAQHDPNYILEDGDEGEEDGSCDEDCEDEEDCEDCEEDEDDEDEEDEEDEVDNDCDEDCGCKDSSNSSYDTNFVHNLQVQGTNGDAKPQLSGSVNVAVGEGGRADLALVFLGDDLKMDGGIIHGDILVTDPSNRAADWDVNSGEHTEEFSNHKGDIEFSGADVDGTLFHYNESEEIQSLGDEVVLTARAKAPAYSLDGFAEEGSGKVHFENTTELQGLYLQDTAVVELQPGQHLSSMVAPSVAASWS